MGRVKRAVYPVKEEAMTEQELPVADIILNKRVENIKALRLKELDCSSMKEKYLKWAMKASRKDKNPWRDEAQNLVKAGLGQILTMPQFAGFEGLKEKAVKILLTRVHDKTLWLNEPIQIDAEVIHRITGLPNKGETVKFVARDSNSWINKLTGKTLTEGRNSRGLKISCIRSKIHQWTATIISVCLTHAGRTSDVMLSTLATIFDIAEEGTIYNWSDYLASLMNASIVDCQNKSMPFRFASLLIMIAMEKITPVELPVAETSKNPAAWKYASFTVQWQEKWKIDAQPMFLKWLAEVERACQQPRVSQSLRDNMGSRVKICLFPDSTRLIVEGATSAPRDLGFVVSDSEGLAELDRQLSQNTEVVAVTVSPVKLTELSDSEKDSTVKVEEEANPEYAFKSSEIRERKIPIRIGGKSTSAPKKRTRSQIQAEKSKKKNKKNDSLDEYQSSESSEATESDESLKCPESTDSQSEEVDKVDDQQVQSSDKFALHIPLSRDLVIQSSNGIVLPIPKRNSVLIGSEDIFESNVKSRDHFATSKSNTLDVSTTKSTESRRQMEENQNEKDIESMQVDPAKSPSLRQEGSQYSESITSQSLHPPSSSVMSKQAITFSGSAIRPSNVESSQIISSSYMLYPSAIPDREALLLKNAMSTEVDTRWINSAQKVDQLVVQENVVLNKLKKSVQSLEGVQLPDASLKPITQISLIVDSLLDYVNKVKKDALHSMVMSETLKQHIIEEHDDLKQFMTQFQQQKVSANHAAAVLNKWTEFCSDEMKEIEIKRMSIRDTLDEYARESNEQQKAILKQTLDLHYKELEEHVMKEREWCYEGRNLAQRIEDPKKLMGNAENLLAKTSYKVHQFLESPSATDVDVAMDVLFDIRSMKQCAKDAVDIWYNFKEAMQVGAKNVYEVCLRDVSTVPILS
jgi:hypothetical protein